VPVLEPGQLALVDGWLRSVLWEGEIPGVRDQEAMKNVEIHRSKARLVFKDGSIKIVQGVREIFEIFDSPNPSSGATEGKIVLIGRGLPGVDFQQSFLDAFRT
jgi:hypothetical protein